MNTKLDAMRAIRRIAGYIGGRQLQAIAIACRGEEKQFFFDKLVELERLVDSMPVVYQQDGKGDEAIAYLHYFGGSANFYITERDTMLGQHQAFGLADLFGDGGELGYISIHEITQAGMELDLHWKPRTLREVKAERE